jgi:endonuclease/exonuclease/phosphatase family metal-dependent hydrolase
MSTHPLRTLLTRSVAAIAVITGILAASRDAGAETGSVQIRAISHNVLGGWVTWRDGPATANGRGNPPAPAKVFALTLAEVDAFAPQIVMLQEVCFATEYLYLQNELGKRGYHLVFDPERLTNATCMPAQEKSCVARACEHGQVLAVKGGLDGVRVIPLPGLPGKDRGRMFKLLCGQLSIRGLGVDGVVACTTHLRANLGSSPRGENSGVRQMQTKKIADELKTYMNHGKLVVLGGDMNAIPETVEMGNLYTIEDGTGDLYEADQVDRRYFTKHCKDAGRSSCRCAEFTESSIAAHPEWKTLSARTYTGKYDYVFWGAPDHTRFTDFSSACVRDAGSDHGLFRATALYSAAGGEAPISVPIGGPHCQDPPQVPLEKCRNPVNPNDP